MGPRPRPGVWDGDEPLIVAAGRAHLATCEALPDACSQLAITHLASEERHEVAVPRGGEFALRTAAFSPDDSRLAVPVHRRGRVEVMITHVEGLARTIALDVEGVPQLAWHPTLPWLFIAADGRLLAVPPDADEARLVTDDLPEQLYGIAVTDPAA